MASETFCSWFCRIASACSASMASKSVPLTEAPSTSVPVVAVRAFASKMRVATRLISSCVDTSGRSGSPWSVTALRRRRTLTMPRSGHGPFSFWHTMARLAPRKSMRLTLKKSRSSSP